MGPHEGVEDGLPVLALDRVDLTVEAVEVPVVVGVIGFLSDPVKESGAQLY